MYANVETPGVGDYLKRLLSNRERAIQLRVRFFFAIASSASHWRAWSFARH